MNKARKTISTCSECKSPFIKERSQMKGLCPECAHHLYGYENCPHEFKNGNCKHCHWNGSNSDYVKSLKNKKN
ncbi:MAG TPA: hypothetical protein VKZ97_07390 [Flavobacteriaceae bacterium]|nr:hypothetical protein [Flavobacteriaceae bacterium]